MKSIRVNGRWVTVSGRTLSYDELVAFITTDADRALAFHVVYPPDYNKLTWAVRKGSGPVPVVAGMEVRVL